MKETIDRLNDLIIRWRDLQPIKTEFKYKLDKKFRLEFNYNSNHLEGNTLSYNETELLLIFDETKGNHTLREYEEMQAHDVALKLIQEWAADIERPLTETNIKNLNKTILVKSFWKNAITPDRQETRREIKVGDYKEFPNSVRLTNGEIFHYASVTDTPILMGELIKWYRAEEEKKELHPVALAALLHYKFVCIHPFDDGNGRISRLLMNYVLFKNNLPPVVIKSAEKKKYLSALNSADAGDINSFIKYIAEQLEWSLELSIKAARSENIEDADDLDKELFVLKKELKGENVLNKMSSADNIADALENNIIPIFILLEEKCEVLKEFFFDWNRTIEFDEAENSVTKRRLGSRDSKWDDLKTNFIKQRVRTSEMKINRLNYNYELKGFKKNVNGNSLWNKIDVNFNPYNYTIFANNKLQQFPYGKKMSDEELLNIVSPLIKNTIDSIKQLNKNQ